MNKKKWLPALVFLTVFCVLPGAGLAEQVHAGKQEAEIPYSFQYDHYLLYCEESVRQRNVYSRITLEDENLTAYRAVFESGDEALRNLVRFDDFDGNIVLWYDTGGISSDGEATFRISLESEHYYADFDYTCEIRNAVSENIGLKGRVLAFPLNREISCSDLRNDRDLFGGLVSDPNGRVVYFTLANRENEYSGSASGYEFDFSHIVFHEPGSYAFYASIHAGGREFFVPFIAYAGPEITAPQAAGGPVLLSDAAGGGWDAIFDNMEETVAAAGFTARPQDGQARNGQEQAAEEKPDRSSLLASAFGMEDDEEDGEETAEEDLSFLNGPSETPAETPSGTETEEAPSKEEMAVLLLQQVKDAMDHPEKQVPVLTDCFLGGETRTDTNVLFSYPVPAGMTLSEVKDITEDGCEKSELLYKDESRRNSMKCTVSVMRNADYERNTEMMRKTYQGLLENIGSSVYNKTIEREDGSLLLAFTSYSISMSEETLRIFTVYKISVVYSYSNHLLLQMDYMMESEPGFLFSAGGLPTEAEFMPLISRIEYSVPENRSVLPAGLLTNDDFAFRVAPEPDTGFVLSGKTVKIVPAYEKSDLKELAGGLAGFEFTAVDAEQYRQGNVVPVDKKTAAVDQKGVLKAGSVNEPVFVTVLARCRETWECRAYTCCILPALKKLGISEKSLTLYAGEPCPVLEGSASPENGWFFGEDGRTNVVWSSSSPEIVSVKDNGDRTASLEALAAGKANVLLTDTLTGKKASVGVTVLVPVSGIEIEGPDAVAAGRSAAYKAVVAPENAGNKKVRWTLDVDGKTATVNAKGQVKIMKGVPAGTVVTLTCEAEGSSSPRTAVKTIVTE